MAVPAAGEDAGELAALRAQNASLTALVASLSAEVERLRAREAGAAAAGDEAAASLQRYQSFLIGSPNGGDGGSGGGGGGSEANGRSHSHSHSHSHSRSRGRGRAHGGVGGVGGGGKSVAAARYLVSSCAGSGVPGFADGVLAAAQFNSPRGVAFLPRGGAAVLADMDNHCVRLLAPGAAGCSASTLAGAPGARGFADGPAATALFNQPRGVAAGAAGEVYVADGGNHRVRLIRDGVVTTLAGSGAKGGADGVGGLASFFWPAGLALGAGRDAPLYVTELGGDRVRVITPNGAVTTLAGRGERGFADGPCRDALFNNPRGIAVDAAGVVFVADSGNHRIRRIEHGVVDTLAGGGDYDESGFADGDGAGALFYHPIALALCPVTGLLLVADAHNNRIRAVDPRTGAVTTLAGTGEEGAADGEAAEASLNGPYGLAVDAKGNALVADTYNHRLRRIARA